MLENPSAKELMQVVAAAGLAQKFCSLYAPDYNRHTGWTHENAFEQHSESI
jgi:hypothetical protein